MSRFHAPTALRDQNIIKIRHASAARTPSEEQRVYDLDYRRKIDNEMTADAADWIRSRADDAAPFFAFVGLTRPHYPNLPSEEFEGQSRIGNYGDCIMELDHNIGRIMAALEDAGVADDTILVFVSDNGPTTTCTLPDEINMASAGPFRGELGDPTEGAIRTVGMVRWPGRIPPRTVYGMVSIMDFLPTFAAILERGLPDGIFIDGIDQSSYLTGAADCSSRESLLTFIGSRLVAVRWNQWRMLITPTPRPPTSPTSERGRRKSRARRPAGHATASKKSRSSCA
jgi:arylsulfatase